MAVIVNVDVIPLPAIYPATAGYSDKNEKPDYNVEIQDENILELDNELIIAAMNPTFYQCMTDLPYYLLSALLAALGNNHFQNICCILQVDIVLIIIKFLIDT